MPTVEMPKREQNLGKNVKEVREVLKIKQETLAHELEQLTGEKWNQRRISWLEDKVFIEPDLLDKVAQALKIPVEVLENWSRDALYSAIGNVVQHVQDHATGQVFQFHPTINNPSVERFMELVDEMRKLNAAVIIEKDAVIKEKDAVIKEKDEKILMLEKLLGQKK